MRRQPDIVVCGTPGAWINSVSSHIHEKGWQVTWSGQDLDIEDGQRFLNKNCQNIQTQRMLEAMPFTLLQTNIPKSYDTPYPGPAEYLDKFSESSPVVVSALHLAPVLDIWAPHVNILVDVRATEDEDLRALEMYTRNRIAKKKLEQIRNVHLERYNKHIQLFGKRFRFANSLVKDKQFFTLDKFLKSVF
jgi:hypothetical protein